MLDMDELVHEADCLAQALRELLSGTTHAGQEAQKYLVGELATEFQSFESCGATA
jgi:hypothetical protein